MKVALTSLRALTTLGLCFVAFTSAHGCGRSSSDPADDDSLRGIYTDDAGVALAGRDGMGQGSSGNTSNGGGLGVAGGGLGIAGMAVGGIGPGAGGADTAGTGTIPGGAGTGGISAAGGMSAGGSGNPQGGSPPMPPIAGAGSGGMDVGGAGGEGVGGEAAQIGDCTQSYDWRNPDWCEQQYTCDDNSTIYSYCYSQPPLWVCDCSGATTRGRLNVTGAGNRSCTYATQLCAGEVSEIGDPVCMPVYESIEPGYCSYSVECLREAALEEDVTGHLVEFRDVSCSASEEQTECNCPSMAGGSLRVIYPAASVPESACRGARAICDELPEPTGPVECSRTFQSASTTSCNANFQCAQTSDVEGATVEISRGVSISCEKQGDAWACYCNADLFGQTPDFELVGNTPWDTCTLAAEMCGQLP